MDVAHPQQLLRELGRLRARLDGHILCHLTLILGPNQRIHELRTFEVLDTLRSSNSARRAEKRCRRPRVLPAIACGIAWLMHWPVRAAHAVSPAQATGHTLAGPGGTGCAHLLVLHSLFGVQAAALLVAQPGSDHLQLRIDGRARLLCCRSSTAANKWSWRHSRPRSGLQVSGPTPCDQTR
jgi:hypothetical protein